MHHALTWLLVVELLGLIALPLTYVLFRRLPDRGLVFSKPLALLVGSYVLWILGLTHMVPNSQFTIIGILLALAIVSILVLRRKLPEIVAFIREHWPPLLAAELVFLGLFLLWIVVVSGSPAINHTEKPMDFAFLNSILQSTHFPPEDPWLAGHSISYYYFGHFMMAFLTKLTAIPSSVSYNLAVALIPALVGAAAFSLVYNLVRLSGGALRTAIPFALMAPLFIVLVSNLEGVMELVNARGWGSDGFWQWLSIKGLDAPNVADSGFFPDQHWWWWRATRVIDTVVDGASLDYTITEFPFFSFLLGDLHPHVSSMPFLLLTLALGLNLFVSRERLGLSWMRANLWETFAITLTLGSLAFINIWDFPIFAVILVVLVLMKGYGDWGGDLRGALVPSITLLVPVLAGAVVLFLPFYMTFSSQASGIGAVGELGTRPVYFFLIWGLFLVVSGAYLLRQLWTVPGLRGLHPGAISAVLVIILLPFLMWAGWRLIIDPFDGGFVDSLGTVAARFGKVLPGLLIVALASYSLILRVRFGGRQASAADGGTEFRFPSGPPQTNENAFGPSSGSTGSPRADEHSPVLSTSKDEPVLSGRQQEAPQAGSSEGNQGSTETFVAERATAFSLLPLALAFYLIVGVELFYLVDLFGGRMNTVFKAYFQSWMFLAIASAYGLYYLHSRSLPSLKTPFRLLGRSVRAPGGKLRATVRYGWLGLVVLLVLGSLYYPIGAALDRTEDGGNNTLDGLAFVRTGTPGEYEAIRWLRDEAPRGRIVEAVGDDYSEYGRISASTGLPTVLGWKFHEHQWRGSTAPFRGREEQVAQIYLSPDANQVRGLLDTYDIRYVYFGSRERTKYGSSHLGRFSSFLQPVFQRSGVVIYERLQGNDLEVAERNDGTIG